MTILICISVTFRYHLKPNNLVLEFEAQDLRGSCCTSVTFKDIFTRVIVIFSYNGNIKIAASFWGSF